MSQCPKCYEELPYRGGPIPIMRCECGGCCCPNCVEAKKDPEAFAKKPRTMGGVILPPGEKT